MDKEVINSSLMSLSSW